MKRIVAIVRKNTALHFSGWGQWLFFLVLPILFTVVLAGGTGPSPDSRIRLYVVDQANSPLSQQLITTLDGSDAVKPEAVTLEKAQRDFDQNRISAILVIPPDLDMAHVKQGPVALELRLQPNDLNAMAASQAVDAALQRASSAVDIANSSVAEAEQIQPFTSDSARAAYWEASRQAAQEQMNQAPERVTVTQGTTSDQVDYDPRANSSAGELITWVFIPLLGISSMFAAERQEGTLRRILTTPTTKATYLLGTILGQVLIALVQMLLLVIFGALVMNLNWWHAPAALAVILISSTLAAAALGTTLGTFIKTEGQAGGLSMALGMVMALLGGCWYPIELFPAYVQTASKVLPTNWAMQGMLDIVLRGQGLEAVLPKAGVLMGFAVVFFAIGVWRFRYE